MRSARCGGCSRGRANDLRIEHSQVEADAETGSAHWEAFYTFRNGRKVHNVIKASFEFRDGLISDHRDWFDLYRWTRQALGPLGFFLGWTPIVHRRIRFTARQDLDLFIAGDPLPD